MVITFSIIVLLKEYKNTAMSVNDYKLDNPVWHSLSEAHKHLAIEFDNIKFYHPDYCPFGGFATSENISDGIAAYSSLIDNFFIVGEKPNFPDSLKLKNELVCNQMILHHKADVQVTEAIAKLKQDDADKLAYLVNLVQPGYFKRKTFLLGDYFGIFKNNELVAVTGERMQMNNYIEVSAVVTHPEHTGTGYAKQLVTYVANNVFEKGKIPYLHVAETNTGAIKLYEKLCFITRRKISFWNLVR